jgi:hypothetical protein
LLAAPKGHWPTTKLRPVELPHLARQKGCFASYYLRSIDELSGRTTGQTRKDTLCPQKQAVMSIRRAGQVYEIHCPQGSSFLWKDMGLDKSSRELIGALGNLASRTGRDILGDKATHIRPI